MSTLASHRSDLYLTRARIVTDEIRKIGVHRLGRRLYETMMFWQTAAN